ncbi:MAG: hypothetical protein GY850_21385 [bacterium]|nr:hypothetical protein [bacterium]
MKKGQPEEVQIDLNPLMAERMGSEPMMEYNPHTRNIWMPVLIISLTSLTDLLPPPPE